MKRKTRLSKTAAMLLRKLQEDVYYRGAAGRRLMMSDLDSPEWGRHSRHWTNLVPSILSGDTWKTLPIEVRAALRLMASLDSDYA